MTGVKVSRRKSQENYKAFLPYLMSKAADRLSLQFQKVLRNKRLTLRQWRVLAGLTEQDGRPISELAARTIVDQTTLSRILVQLERRKLVSRSRRAGDNRFVEVFVTNEGRHIVDDIRPVGIHCANEALKGLDERERRALALLLQKLLYATSTDDSSF